MIQLKNNTEKLNSLIQEGKDSGAMEEYYDNEIVIQVNDGSPIIRKNVNRKIEVKSQEKINYEQIVIILNEQNRALKEIKQHLSDIEKILNERLPYSNDQNFN